MFNFLKFSYEVIGQQKWKKRGYEFLKNYFQKKFDVFTKCIRFVRGVGINITFLLMMERHSLFLTSNLQLWTKAHT